MLMQPQRLGTSLLNCRCLTFGLPSPLLNSDAFYGQAISNTKTLK